MSYLNVTAAVIIDKNNILAAKRSPGKHLAGHWEFPGGKIEPGETPEQCLKRELKEIELVIQLLITGDVVNYRYDVVLEKIVEQ